MYRAVALLLLSVAPVRCWLSRACLALTAQHRTTKCAGHDCGVVQWYLFRNCGAPNGGAPQLRKSYQYRGVDTIMTPLLGGSNCILKPILVLAKGEHYTHTPILDKVRKTPLKIGWRHRSLIWEFYHLWGPVQIVSTL